MEKKPTEESLREEFVKKFDGWKIHHKSVPCVEDKFVINEIYDFFLSHFKHLLLSHSARIPKAVLAELIKKLG